MQLRMFCGDQEGCNCFRHMFSFAEESKQNRKRKKMLSHTFVWEHLLLHLLPYLMFPGPPWIVPLSFCLLPPFFLLKDFWCLLLHDFIFPSHLFYTFPRLPSFSAPITSPSSPWTTPFGINPMIWHETRVVLTEWSKHYNQP